MEVCHAERDELAGSGLKVTLLLEPNSPIPLLPFSLPQSPAQTCCQGEQEGLKNPLQPNLPLLGPLEALVNFGMSARTPFSAPLPPKKKSR